MADASVWDDLGVFSEENVYAERAVARGRDLEEFLSLFRDLHTQGYPLNSPYGSVLCSRAEKLWNATHKEPKP